VPGFTHLDDGASTTHPFVTNSINPPVGRGIAVAINAYVATGGVNPSAPTITGNGITYTAEETVDVDVTGSTDRETAWVFRGKLASTSSGTITITFSGVIPTRCSWSIDLADTDVDSGGANAANMFVAGTRNKANPASTVTTNPVSFNGTMTSGNGAYYMSAIENNNSQTQEAGWTQLANVISTSLVGLSTAYLTSGTDTGTATTWTTAARAGAILLEVKAAPVVPPGDTSESKFYTPGFMSAAGFPSFLVSLAAPFQRAIAPFAGFPVAALPGTIPGVEPEAHAHNPVIIDGNDNLYRLTESDLVNPPAAGNHPLMYKSIDGGITWTDMDSANRPTAQDLEATWVMRVGTQIIVFVNRDDTVWRVPFNTSDSGTPDTWGTQETVDTSLSSTGVEQFVSVTRTSDGQEWIFYSDTLVSSNQQMAYRRRTGVNTYGSKSDLGGNTAVSYTGPSAVLGASDLSHVFYTDVTNAHLYYRTLSSTGTLSSATQVDSAGTSGFSASPSRYVHTNAVYYDDAGTEVISVMYADTSNMLKLVRVVGGTPQTPEAVSTNSVLTNPSATTSDAIIAHLAIDGTTTLAIWSDAGTGDLLWRQRDAAGTWGPITTLWASGGNLAYYVYNTVFTRAGRRIMGYVYDVGDHPNDISNLRYNEADLGAGASGVTITPATVAAVASVPSGTIQAGSVVTPAAVAAVASVPAPTVQLGAAITSATVAALATIPAPTVQAGSVVSAVMVAGVAAVPGPTVQAGVTVTPATVTAVATVPAPAVSAGGSATVSPAAVAATAAVPAPAPQTGSTVTAAAVAAAATVPAPTVRAGAVTQPSPVTAVATVPGATVLAGSKTTPTTVATTAAVPSATIRISAVITPGSVAAVAAMPTPILHALVPIFTVAAVATIPTPTVVTIAAYTPLIDPVTVVRLNTAAAGPRANLVLATARPNAAEAIP
jgi:hypothetical protein